MAKCVKINWNGKIERLPNEVAAELVKNGHASYAPKSEYKQRNIELLKAQSKEYRALKKASNA